ncbi:MAG: hypothetical protein ACI9JN_002576 [Bacteroidia bacterium]|jgi:hypothetical protein
MKVLFLILISLVSIDIFGQGRDIDIGIKITDPQDGDYFVSPSKRLITVYLYNYGPDTIIPKDEFYVEFIFSAFHIFPKFLSFDKTVIPGDSFMYQRELDINYSGDVESMKFCAEAFAYSKGRDSIRSETGFHLNNNKNCVQTKHIDSSSFLDVIDINDLVISSFPNPVEKQLSIHANQLIANISVFNLKGQLLYVKKHVNTLDYTFNMSNFTTGIYFLSVETEAGMFTQKIIRE